MTTLAMPAAPETAPPPAAPTGLRLAAEELHAWYGAAHAVKGVSLELAPNEVTAIIGPSGCGKSTFVRCLNRMHEEVPGARVAGRVTLDGEDVYGDGVDPAAVRSVIGMVFQQAHPFPTMSIFDNVAAGLRLRGGRRVRRARLRERVERALQDAGLWEEVKDRLGGPGVGLSGGQQQRLCIARAIALEPEVLLLDEPASALDPASAARIEGLLSALKERYTIAIVTHNMQQAARVADRTAFFLDGELVEAGTTERIFANPQDERTAHYVSGRFG